MSKGAAPSPRLFFRNVFGTPFVAFWENLVKPLFWRVSA